MKKVLTGVSATSQKAVGDSHEAHGLLGHNAGDADSEVDFLSHFWKWACNFSKTVLANHCSCNVELTWFIQEEEQFELSKTCKVANSVE